MAVHDSFGHWDGVSIYWLIWAVVGFLPVELWALWTGHPQDSLSDNVWRLERSGFAHFWVAAFMVWLTLHFVEHWFR